MYMLETFIFMINFKEEMKERNLEDDEKIFYDLSIFMSFLRVPKIRKYNTSLSDFGKTLPQIIVKAEEKRG